MEEYDDIVQEPDSSGVLDLSHRAWVTLDPEVWENSNKVQVFNLSYNSIKVLSPGVERLQMMVELNISCNQLEELPNELCRCLRLRILRVNGNKLTKFPPDIVKCALLEEIYASENVLLEVPENIHKMVTLKCLQLQNNKLSMIPSNLGKCLLLEQVNVSNNPIQNIPQDACADTERLLWMCRHNRVYDDIILELEEVNADLETLASSTEELKANMRDEIKALKMENDSLIAERPTKYLKIKHYAQTYGRVVCVIQ